MEFPDSVSHAPLAPHRIEAQQQATRDDIRHQVDSLPRDEAAAFRALLDSFEAAIKIKKEEEAKQVFPWDKLSGEIQNMILRELMVTPQLIEPSLESPRKAQGWRKYDLGANILTISKAMHDAALPILLGENTFVLNKAFNHILGKGKKRSKLRGALIRNIIVPSELEPRMRLNLRKLTHLNEVTIVDDGWADLRWSDTQTKKEDKVRRRFKHVDEALRAKIANCPESSINFVAKGLFWNGSNLSTRMVLACRWEVKKDDSATDGFHLSLVRKKEYDYDFSQRKAYPPV